MRAIFNPVEQTKRRRVAFALIVRLLALSLAVSVASRFVHYYVMLHPATGVRCDCRDNKRQDLERDAEQWTAPVPQISILYLPKVRIELPPAPMPRYEFYFDDSLYKRPPPVLSPLFVS